MAEHLTVHYLVKNMLLGGGGGQATTLRPVFIASLQIGNSNPAR